MKITEKLKIATYNIQFSNHPEQIKTNILKMADMGVSVFCLQEVVRDTEKPFILNILLKSLGSDWQAIYSLGEEKSNLGMGNCIVWNAKQLTLKKEQKELLPKSDALAIHEKVFSWLVGGITVPLHRRVIIGYFKFNNTVIRIINIHLDNNGGLKNRTKQLSHIVNNLNKDTSVNHEIMCGDFNSFDLLKSGKEIMAQQKILGDYFIDISKDSGWTADINNIDINGGIFLKWLIKITHLHIRRKLDYIWAKNITSSKCEKLILEGSDHYPLIAQLDI